VEADSSKALRDLWLQKSKVHRKKAGQVGCVTLLLMFGFWLTTIISLALGTVGLLLVIVSPALMGDAEGGEPFGLADVVELSAWTLLALGIGLGLLLWIVRARRDFRLGRSLVAGQQQLPDSAEWRAVQEDVEQLAAKLNIARVRLVADPSLGRTKLFTVTIKDEIAIVIPEGFLIWRQVKPRAALGVLAHELAHVAQEDPKIWRKSLIAAQAGIIGVILTLGTTLVEVVIKLTVAPDYHIGPTGFGWPIALVFYYRMRRSRYVSEYLADLGAAVAVGPEAVKEALLSLRSDSWRERLFRRATHPTPFARRQRLEDTLAAVGLADLLPRDS
jgi:Zn-dependent protease with chaperone function